MLSVSTCSSSLAARGTGMSTSSSGSHETRLWRDTFRTEDAAANDETPQPRRRLGEGSRPGPRRELYLPRVEALSRRTEHGQREWRIDPHICRTGPGPSARTNL